MELSDNDETKEWEARANAVKEVARLVQRPDQLEKIDHYKRQAIRKQAAVDALLKTAVQSQLDGVRTGLDQLTTAVADIVQVRDNFALVQKSFTKLCGLQEKLKPIHDLNRKHGEYFAAMGHFKHIFTVPETVQRVQELVAAGDLLVAHTLIRDLENSRDDLMLELDKHQSHSVNELDRLNAYFSDVPVISRSLLAQINSIMERVFASLRHDPTIVVSCLRIIEREERADAAAARIQTQFGFSALDRPKRWRNRIHEKFYQTVENRIAGCQIETREADKMWLVRHLELIRQITLGDLKIARRLCPPAFPPSWKIVDDFVAMYHKAISEHLVDMVRGDSEKDADNPFAEILGLRDNEVVTLLSWVFNTYYGPEMMGDPELRLDGRKQCGPLIDDSILSLLKAEYVETTSKNICEWVDNTLRSEVGDWYRERPPDSDGRGFYITQLPVILFEMMEQNLAVAAIFRPTSKRLC